MKKIAAMFTCFITVGTLAFAQAEKQTKVPPPPPPAEKVKFAPPVIVRDDDIKEFYKRNPSVSEAYWNKERHFVVKLKDKSTEEYNLDNEKDKENFIGKYGTPLPSLPPPPPSKKEIVKFTAPKIVKDTIIVKEQQ